MTHVGSAVGMKGLICGSLWTGCSMLVSEVVVSQSKPRCEINNERHIFRNPKP